MPVTNRVKVNRLDLISTIKNYRDSQVARLTEESENTKNAWEFIKAEREKARKGSNVDFGGKCIEVHVWGDGADKNSAVVRVVYEKRVKLPKGVKGFSNYGANEDFLKNKIESIKTQCDRDLKLLELSQDETISINANDYSFYF